MKNDGGLNMNTNNDFTPLLRFPEYRTADSIWEKQKIGDIVKTIVPPKKLQSNEFKKTGKYPIVDQSQKYICGYSDDNLALINGDANDLIIFGDHTCILKFIDFPFIQGADGIKIMVSSNPDKISTRFLFQFLKAFPIESNEYKRHFSELKEKTVFYPKMIEEQYKIADCFFSIDSCLSSINEKIEQLKAHKKSLMQKLFPQNGQTVPEYRFPEFRSSDEWNNKKMGDITVVVNRRNKSNRSLPIYSISNTDGFVPQSEQFDGLDSKSRGYDISLYKVVGRNTFAYNPARINIGSFGYSGNLKEVLISSLYVCFKTTDEIDDEFMICFLNTAHFRRAVESNVEGGIRSYLFYENFSRINIIFPTIQEQRKISSVIKSIDKLLFSNQRRVSLLEEQKKGLMQKLFPSTSK